MTLICNKGIWWMQVFFCVVNSLLLLPPAQACFREPLLRVVQPSPAGPLATSPWSTLRFWPVKWDAHMWRPQTWWTVSAGKISESWWIRTSSQPATTLHLDLWWTETLCQMTPRSWCSRWSWDYFHLWGRFLRPMLIQHSLSFQAKD